MLVSLVGLANKNERGCGCPAGGEKAAKHKVDSCWPKPLPNIWIGGNRDNDHEVLKLSHDGTCLLQIGHTGKTGGSNDMKLLGRLTDVDVDPKTNEVYVADGYLNKRASCSTPARERTSVTGERTVTNLTIQILVHTIRATR